MRAFHKLNNLSILLPEIVFAHEIEVPVEGRRVVDETVVAERFVCLGDSSRCLLVASEEPFSA